MKNIDGNEMLKFIEVQLIPEALDTEAAPHVFDVNMQYF